MLGLVYTECQHQRCDDASDTTLIENNGLAQCKRALQFNPIYYNHLFASSYSLTSRYNLAI